MQQKNKPKIRQHIARVRRFVPLIGVGVIIVGGLIRPIIEEPAVKAVCKFKIPPDQSRKEEKEFTLDNALRIVEKMDQYPGCELKVCKPSSGCEPATEQNLTEAKATVAKEKEETKTQSFIAKIVQAIGALIMLPDIISLIRRNKRKDPEEPATRA